MYTGLSVNNAGALVSHHMCEECLLPFTCTPSQIDNLENFRFCLDDECPSYDVNRDPDMLVNCCGAKIVNEDGLK